MKLNQDQKDQIQDLINETILPALYEDIEIPNADDLSDGEFEAAQDALLSYLIDQLQNNVVKF
jgi:hypothetical protein